jgi:hypothetical protein
MAMTVPSPITRRRWLVAVCGLLIAPAVGYAVTLSPKAALLITLLGVSGMVLMAKPTWAVYALIVGTFFDSIGLPTGFAILGAGDLACFALVPIWLAHRMLIPQNLELPKGVGYLLLFMGLSCASMVLGVAPEKAYTGYVRLVFYIVVLIALVDLIRDIDVLDKVLVIIAVCALAQAIIGFALPTTVQGRMSGLVQQSNILGAKIAFGVFPMGAFLLRTQRLSLRVVIGFALVAMLVAIGLTMSRGTYIGVVVGALFWVRNSAKSVVLLAAVASLAFVGLNNLAAERVGQIEQRLQFDGKSSANRGQVMLNALKAIEKYPILGVGFGQFQDLDSVVEVSAEAGRGGHSFYLSTAAASGLPALIVFLLFARIQMRNIGLLRTKLRRENKGQLEPHSVEKTETPWGDRVRALWIVNTIQAMMVFHGVSLVVRGSQRLTEWTMFGLYAATAMLIFRGKDTSISTETNIQK